ncbi:hypothetical protein P7K49_039570, partial [Saguinus oedipus]
VAWPIALHTAWSLVSATARHGREQKASFQQKWVTHQMEHHVHPAFKQGPPQQLGHRAQPVGTLPNSEGKGTWHSRRQEAQDPQHADQQTLLLPITKRELCLHVNESNCYHNTEKQQAGGAWYPRAHLSDC